MIGFPMMPTRHGLRLFAELIAEQSSVEVVQERSERCCAHRAVGQTIDFASPVIVAMAKAVEDAVQPFGFGISQTAPAEVSAADAAVSKALHDSLSASMTVGIAADTQVWTALSLAVLPGYIKWRWMGRVSKLEDRVAVRSRHMLGRLWWRAHMAYDGRRTNAYELLAMKEQFWNQVEERTSVYQDPALVHDIMVEASSRKMVRQELSAAMQAIRAQLSFSCLAVLPATARRAVVARAFDEHAPLRKSDD